MSALGCAGMALMLVVGIPSVAAAQVTAAAMTLGYQYQWVPAGAIPAGFTLDVSVPLRAAASFVGQFDWSRKSEPGVQLSSTQTVFMVGGGIRWSQGGPTIRPFIQLLAGVARNSFHDTFSNNNPPYLAGRTIDSGGTFALAQAGGGLSVSLSPRVSAVGQIDYRPYLHTSAVWSSARAVAGIRVTFK